MMHAEGECPLSLSPLKPGQVDGISRMLCSMDPWLTLGYKPELFKLYFLRADACLKRCSIEISGLPAGVLAVRFPWLFGPFIELIAVFDGFRGRGTGRGVIDLVCNNYAAPNLWATVSAFNKDAQRFYSSVGFEAMGTLKDLIKPGWDEILLRKRVSR